MIKTRTSKTQRDDIRKLVHISIDLVLVSTCLAGIKRNTGLTPKVETLDNQTMRNYMKRYLNLGESVYDYSVATCGSSTYFARK
ncbi:AIC_G0025680.mRNA.1.CDS.1 [Saccharomyces cerevisiae]|nr:AIC_G0025680.mRNA.1.CDS.1 [Saccharomyces cerevisiae]CAI6595315.1 AIC_G0025680.mRNA.1.CDS.1 [Saccharomyces cerevisiae]